MTNDKTTTYRVSETQSGRAQKGVWKNDEYYAPGETFEARPGINFFGRAEEVDGDAAADDAASDPDPVAETGASDAADASDDASAGDEESAVELPAVGATLGYPDVSVTDLRESLSDVELSDEDKAALIAYEEATENRKTAIEAIEDS